MPRSATRGHSSSDLCHSAMNFSPHNPLPGLIMNYCFHLFVIIVCLSLFIPCSLCHFSSRFCSCHTAHLSALPCLLSLVFLLWIVCKCFDPLSGIFTFTFSHLADAYVQSPFFESGLVDIQLVVQRKEGCYLFESNSFKCFHNEW